MTEVISSNGENPTATTVLEFFDSLLSGTYVQLHGTPYVFNGIEEETIKLFTESGANTELRADAQNENRWEKVTLNNGSAKLASPELLAAFRSAEYYRTQRNSLRTSYENQLEQLRAEKRTQRMNFESDWQMLNDFINEYADEQNMCSDYERRLERWNGSFSEMNLQGRERNWNVQVRITVDHTFQIRARSEEDAKELAEDMDLSTIRAELNNNRYIDYTLDVDDVELS